MENFLNYPFKVFDDGDEEGEEQKVRFILELFLDQKCFEPAPLWCVGDDRREVRGAMRNASKSHKSQLFQQILTLLGCNEFAKNNVQSGNVEMLKI